MSLSETGRAPAISIIIPAYNAARYLGEALNSIFAQSFRDYEIIVVNDGSPDTEELEAVISSCGQEIHYIKQTNRGPAAARNNGIRQARGRYLAFLDADDLWLADYLATVFDFLEQNPAIDMVCTDCVYFGHPDWDGKSWQSLYGVADPVTFEKLLPTQGGAFISFVLLRKATAERVGFFEEELLILEDYHYWLRLLYGGGKIAYLRKVLGKRRLHAGNLTRDHSAILPYAANALERLSAVIPADSREGASLRKQLAITQSRLAIREGKRKLSQGDYRGASELFQDAQATGASRKIRFLLFGLRFAPNWTRWAVSRLLGRQ